MDWYDGPAAMTISQAMSCAERMPAKPKSPTWDNMTPVFESDLGGIYELLTMNDRKMHTHTCSGHCFVWNAPNQKYEDGFRLYTFRSPDGWGRVSILAHELDSLIAGTGSRMYCGNWRTMVEQRGAREINGEAVVLLDYDSMYVYGETMTQATVNQMKVLVGDWWETLVIVDVPAPTEEELARKIVHGMGWTAAVEARWRRAAPGIEQWI